MLAGKKGYPYKDSYGDEFTVYPKLDMYADNDNLYVGLDSFDEDLGGIDQYCDLTVNIYKLPYLCSCVNIEYGGDQHMKFLEEQGIGQFTGKWMPSGARGWTTLCPPQTPGAAPRSPVNLWPSTRTVKFSDFSQFPLDIMG